MAKDENKRKSIKHAKIITEVCISAVILALGVYAVVQVVKSAKPLGRSSLVEESVIDVGETTEQSTEDTEKEIYQTASVETKDKFKGDLILVNRENEYFGGSEDLIILNQQLEADGVTAYVGNDNDTKIRKEIYSPLTDMISDFNEASGYDDIVILEGYRTNERQQELYENDLEQTGLEESDHVAEPGHSEHETGYSVDLTTSTTWDYDGTGKYDWINKNCWKYGFILRYTPEKEDITGFPAEPWHYRYVGVPHAYYMYENGLCLEEYINLVREHTYDGEHLVFTDGTDDYEVYFVPSDDGSDSTYIPVASTAEYDVSGNNKDGFIVTVYTDRTLESNTSGGSGSVAEEQTGAAGTTAESESSAGESTASEETPAGEQ